MDFTNLPFAESELNKRALIWTMKLGRLAKTLFNNYLAHCEYDLSNPSEVEKQKIFQNTVKEVLSVLIWLSIIQIKAKYTVGDWLKTLTLEAFAISDVMQPSPSSFDIMNKYNLTKDGLEATTKLSFALWVTRTHFSISAGIGLISLFGVSIQNGVILVSLVRQFIDQGMTIKNAVIQSTLIRVKPALMTSTVAMAGLIPAAISTGIGSQSQRPIAIIISIGLLPSILLSLIVLPTLYELVERKFGNKKYVNENKLEALNLIK